MMMRRYWRCYIWEMAAAVAAAVPLVLLFSQGFYIPDQVADSAPLALLVCGIVLLYCYFGAYGRLTMVLFSLGFCLIGAGFFLWIQANGITIVDQEGSATAVYIYYLTAPIISVLTFLLSRSGLGSGILFLCGICLYAVTVFLGFETRIWWLAVFVLAVLVLYLLRLYRARATQNNTVDPKFGRFSGAALFTSILGAGLACLIFFAVIRPLDPPTSDMKFLTKYINFTTDQVVAVTQWRRDPNEELYSSQKGDAQRSSSEESEEHTEEEQPEEVGRQEGEETTVPDIGDGDQKDLSTVSYADRAFLKKVVAIVLVILLLIAIPLARWWWRRFQVARLRRGDSRQQIMGFYRFYLRKFRRLGFRRARNQTETEYADMCSLRLDPYTEGGMGLRKLTERYLEARYGHQNIPASDCEACAALYPLLLRNYRKLHGPVRYLLRYFIL